MGKAVSFLAPPPSGGGSPYNERPSSTEGPFFNLDVSCRGVL